MEVYSLKIFSNFFAIFAEGMGESLINKLKSQIDILISRYEKAETENVKLKKQLDDTSAELLLSNNKIKELEQRLDNIQLREAFRSSSADVTQAKKKISLLIKEIDTCLALIDKDNDS